MESMITKIQSIRYATSTVVSQWLAEWQQIALEAIPSLGADYSREIRICFDDTHIILYWYRDDEWCVMLRVADDEEGRRNLLNDISQVTGTTIIAAGVTLALPETSVLCPKIRMPRASRKTLCQAIQFEIARLCPISPDKVYYDFIATPTEDPYTLQIDIRIFDKEKTDELISRCAAAGLNVTNIVFLPNIAPHDTAFVIDKYKFTQTLIRRYCTLVFFVTFLITLIVFISFYCVREEKQLDALNNEVVAAQIQAARIERTRHRIATTEKQLLVATERKRDPALVEVLRTLTDTLPDTAWISTFEVVGNRVRIHGTATTASELIELIDHADHFYDARFEAPVVQDTANKKEHFDISFAVSARKK